MAASGRPGLQPRLVPRVLLVTSGHRLAPGVSAAARIARLERQARDAFAAGVDAVQIREEDLDGGALLELAGAIAALGRVIVTDRADVAVAAGASGVHLKSTGPEAGRVRAILPAHMTLSRAVHSAAEAAEAGAGGALDWVLAGTAFASVSKPGRAPLGAAGLRAIVEASPVPVVAIGGVTAANARDLLAAGAAGVAGIGLFLAGIAPEHVDTLRLRY
ncbi:MAG TPA: thiamine phosphate synthase [Vicinamibacterales bacterium]